MAYQLIMIRCLNFTSAYLLAKNMVLYYFTISGLVLNMILVISKHVLNIVKISILSKFDHDLVKNVTSRAYKRFYFDLT